MSVRTRHSKLPRDTHELRCSCFVPRAKISISSCPSSWNGFRWSCNVLTRQHAHTRLENLIVSHVFKHSVHLTKHNYARANVSLTSPTLWSWYRIVRKQRRVWNWRSSRSSCCNANIHLNTQKRTKLFFVASVATTLRSKKGCFYRMYREPWKICVHTEDVRWRVAGLIDTIIIA